MKTTVVIEKGTENTYAMYLDVEGIGANGVGDTIDGAYQNLLEGMAFAKECLEESGDEIPEYLTHTDFVYVYDVAALLERFSWINTTELAKTLGINPTLMRQYKSRIKFASKKQLLKIQDGIHQMGKQLAEVSLV